VLTAVKDVVQMTAGREDHFSINRTPARFLGFAARKKEEPRKNRRRLEAGTIEEKAMQLRHCVDAAVFMRSKLWEPFFDDCNRLYDVLVDSNERMGREATSMSDIGDSRNGRN
jgi:hypothetical protein